MSILVAGTVCNDGTVASGDPTTGREGRDEPRGSHRPKCFLVSRRQKRARPSVGLPPASVRAEFKPTDPMIYFIANVVRCVPIKPEVKLMWETAHARRGCFFTALAAVTKAREQGRFFRVAAKLKGVGVSPQEAFEANKAANGSYNVWFVNLEGEPEQLCRSTKDDRWGVLYCPRFNGQEAHWIPVRGVHQGRSVLLPRPQMAEGAREPVDDPPQVVAAEPAAAVAPEAAAVEAQEPVEPARVDTSVVSDTEIADESTVGGSDEQGYTEEEYWESGWVAVPQCTYDDSPECPLDSVVWRFTNGRVVPSSPWEPVGPKKKVYRVIGESAVPVETTPFATWTGSSRAEESMPRCIISKSWSVAGTVAGLRRGATRALELGPTLLGQVLYETDLLYTRDNDITSDERFLMNGAYNPDVVSYLVTNRCNYSLKCIERGSVDGVSYRLWSLEKQASTVTDHLVSAVMGSWARRKVTAVRFKTREPTAALVENIVAPSTEAQYRAAYALLRPTLPEPVRGVFTDMRNEEMSLEERSGKEPVDIAARLERIHRDYTAAGSYPKAFGVC